MTEVIFNALWFALAVAAFVITPRRSRQVTLTVACAVALLFPIISISDDFIDRDALDDVFAVVVTLFVVAAALMALATVEPQRRSRAALLVATLSDPRSPPRA